MAFLPRGLRRVRIWQMNGTAPTMVELDAAQSLGLNPQSSTGELRGNDQVVDSFAILTGVDIDGQAGGIPLDALSIMIGSSLTTTGTSPNTVERLSLVAGTNLPYFKMAGISATTGGGAMHVFFPKVQLQTLPNGTMQDENYFISGFSAKAIGDSDNGGISADIRNLETLVELPDVFPSLT